MLSNSERNPHQRILPPRDLPAARPMMAIPVQPGIGMRKLFAFVFAVLCTGTIALSDPQPPGKQATKPQGKATKNGRTSKAAPLAPITDFKLKKIASQTYNFVWSFAFSPNSQLLIAPLWDTCRVLDVKTGKELRSINRNEIRAPRWWARVQVSFAASPCFPAATS